MRNKAVRLVLGLAAALPLLAATNARAASLDLTGGTAASNCAAVGGTLFTFGGITYCQAFGAVWTTTDSQSTGTGVIDSFVRIGSNQTSESGMNTDARPLPQDENSSPVFTHDLPESAVPIVNINGTWYYEFLLDINQTGEDPFLSLTGLELCHTASDDQTISKGATTCAGTNFYSLGNNSVELDYFDNSGSGSGDLFVYIQAGSSTGFPNSEFIYLWSKFGPVPNDANDGFEEWAVRTTTPVNIPDSGSTLSLLGLAMLGAGYLRRRLT
jgi:hypothetical protein